MPAKRPAPLSAQIAAAPGAPGTAWFVVALALLSCLPVLAATLPQMGDYPAHLARYHVMLEIGRNATLERFYAFDWWWSGNVGVDLVIGPLARLFGLELAGRIVAGAIPPLTGLGIIAVEWALRRRLGLGSVLAFAFIWSPALLLGFVNFTLSLALALFAFAGWVLLEGRRWRALMFLPAALVVWLCHVSGWGILGLMVFGYEWSRSKSLAAFLAPWPLTLPVIPLLFGGGTKGVVGYGAYVQIYKLAIWGKAMRDHIEWLDRGSLVVVVAVLLLALWRRRIDWRIGWGAVIVLLGSLAMPRHIAGGDYADYRMISTGLMLACLAIDWQVPRAVLALAAMLFLGRLGLTTADWRADSQRAEAMLAALDHVPQGARIASAVAVPRSDWAFDPFEHIGGYAVVRRDALVNMHFALPKVHMIRLKNAPAGFVDPSQRVFVTPGTGPDLADFAPARSADWLWYVGAKAPVRLPPGAVVVWRGEGSLLARLANGGGAR
ncbi:MAG: hypothetical protein KGL44_02025 [Sphingomonadales bacterium]|nr:hypothetical protein [Sphingomonadales bacterium]